MQPYNEARYFDKCNLVKNGNESYSIKCSPKRSVYALMNTLHVDITNLLKNRRLSSIVARVLENAVNTTLIPDLNSPGVINYTYDPKINSFISFIQILGFEEYIKSNNTNNATGKIFIRGSIKELDDWKKFMRFSAKIITSNSGEEKIEVIGEKDNTTRDEGYIIYNLEYRNTIGKTLLLMESLNNYEFSDSELFTTSTQGKKIYTYPT